MNYQLSQKIHELISQIWGVQLDSVLDYREIRSLVDVVGTIDELGTLEPIERNALLWQRLQELCAHFKIVVSDNELSAVNTVGDLVRLVHKHNTHPSLAS